MTKTPEKQRIIVRYTKFDRRDRLVGAEKTFRSEEQLERWIDTSEELVSILATSYEETSL